MLNIISMLEAKPLVLDRSWVGSYLGRRKLCGPTSIELSFRGSRMLPLYQLLVHGKTRAYVLGIFILIFIILMDGEGGIMVFDL
jgi:hypothetical protein